MSKPRKTDLESFFRRYEEGANTFDPDLIMSQFAPTFGSGDPNGVVPMSNDATFRKAIPERKALFQRIGFQRARVLDVEPTPLTRQYTLAKVHWYMLFEQQPGNPQEFQFYVSYVLFDDGSGPRVVLVISHDDEHKVMREAGLLDDEKPKTKSRAA